ncbi:uncharacterized protein [Parasteatoda tepidariorum]|uniref:uncharacterized protein n=1 Tax=Parasteatoda tepidariorum TaxID=114398 RepID=UPI0039BC4634
MEYDVIGEESILHSLFGGVKKTENHRRYLVHISNVDNSYHCNFEVLDQEVICSNISRINLFPHIKELKSRSIFLTDTTQGYNDQLLYQSSPLEIHLLIGADIAGKLLSGSIEELSSGLVCVGTKLGWTLMGKNNKAEEQDSTNTVLSCHVNDVNISDLWRLDTLGIADPSEKKTREELEQSAKEHFFRTVTRDSEGRYQVRLPWIDGHSPLKNCKGISEKRLENCIKSLKKLGKITDYETIFDDWLDQGIIEEAHCSEPEHYLPHRPVFKENSTTKVRPVFDGSARDKESPSINDCLEKGPNLVELIPSVINRFRKGKYGVVSDIEKAFLQIGLHEQDRAYLKFFWWQNGKKEHSKIFQHRRVVFGISSSPFLLGATLEFHLNNVSSEYKETSQKLLKSFYVDNCVHSVENKAELVKFIHESQEILASAKFNLRGWEHTPFEEFESELIETKTVPVLGLKWDSKKDILSIDLRDLDLIAKNQSVTKRNILSTVHKIFDPIGFTCPVTLIPKLILQECWKLKLSWDSELPSWMAKKFNKWKDQLKILNDISIPRCLDKNERVREITLHVFCDASEKAYAACVFLRSEAPDSITCQLIQARSRVAH